MRKIKIDEIAKAILENEHIEDADYFEYLIEEAKATQALAFFDISYEDRTLSIPDAFDVDNAIEIVNEYLEEIEESSDWTNYDAKRYNDYTEPHRGADDGTFDYAGTFVISILCVIQAILN